MSDTPRLDAQMAFLAEADRLKLVTRATRIGGGARFENSAEHSWHIALYALTLAEHAPEGVQIDRVIRMLLRRSGSHEVLPRSRKEGVR